MWAIVNKNWIMEKKVIKVKNASLAVKLFNPSFLGDVEGYTSNPTRPTLATLRMLKPPLIGISGY